MNCPGFVYLQIGMKFIELKADLVNASFFVVRARMA
jgi:hypothetical protein